MFVYIVKKVILFIPTWLIVSIIIFGLSKMTFDDPVLNKLNNTSDNTSVSELEEDLYRQTAQEMGLDKPLFYFTITTAAFPKNAYTVIRQDERLAIQNLTYQYGNWSEIDFFHRNIKAVLTKLAGQDSLTRMKGNLQQLLIQDKKENINLLLSELITQSQHTPLYKEVKQLENDFINILQKPIQSKLYTPVFYWYGLDNQYHIWLSQFLRGEFGQTNNGQNVLTRLSTPLSITLFLSLITILLTYIIGVPLGILLTQKKNTKGGNWLSSSIFAIYSIPTFWLAMLAVRFLTTPEFGIKLFPRAGLSDLNPNDSIITYLLGNIPNFLLPILCISIHPIMYIARLTNAAIQDNMNLDYVRTARAKGLAQKPILYQHILKNASFPLITIFGQFFPFLITGSFMIEYIFNIQGMGSLTLEALSGRDWHIVYTVFMFSTFLILLGNLVSDILYALVNPKVELI